MQPNPATALSAVRSEMFITQYLMEREKGAAQAAPSFAWSGRSAAAAADVRLALLLNLLLQQRNRIVRVLEVRNQIVGGTADKNRLMFGNFMIVLSNSTITGSSSASAQPLSCPEYLPGDDVSVRVGAAPLKVMSYFSYGSIVRL